MSAYVLKSCHLPQLIGKGAQTNGQCAAQFVLHNGNYFILKGNLIILPATLNIP